MFPLDLNFEYGSVSGLRHNYVAQLYFSNDKIVSRIKSGYSRNA